MTFRDIINDALRELGVLSVDQSTADTADANFGLRKLNGLLDQWKAEQRMIYYHKRTIWTITSGTGSYTVGTGGTINVDRPAKIDRVTYLDTSVTPNQERQLGMLFEPMWQRIMFKDQQSVLPTYWYYDNNYSSGLGTIYLWPVPTSTTITGVLYAALPIGRVTSLSETFDLPPGYERMIVTNLAVEMAPGFGRVVDNTLAMRAEKSMRVVQRSNKRLAELSIDPAWLIGASTGTYDINTDL